MLHVLSSVLYMLCKYHACCAAQLIKPDEKDGRRSHGLFFLFFPDCLLSDRHMNCPSDLPLYPYLYPSIPPHLPNPTSRRILSHPLDSLSVSQRCVFFHCLCAVDFELWMPRAPRRDLRGPAVWPWIYHISPAAMKRQTPLRPAHHKYWPQQQATEARCFSDCTQIDFMCGKKR